MKKCRHHKSWQLKQLLLLRVYLSEIRTENFKIYHSKTILGFFNFGIFGSTFSVATSEITVSGKSETLSYRTIILFSSIFLDTVSPYQKRGS